MDAKARREARRARILASGEERLSKITQIYSNSGDSSGTPPAPAVEGSPAPAPSIAKESPTQAPDEPLIESTPKPSSPPQVAAIPIEKKKNESFFADASPKSVTRQISKAQIAEHLPARSSTPPPFLPSEPERNPDALMQRLLSDSRPGAAQTQEPAKPWDLAQIVRSLMIALLAAVAFWSVYELGEFGIGEDSDDPIYLAFVVPFKKSHDFLMPMLDFYGSEITVSMCLITLEALLVVSHFYFDSRSQGPMDLLSMAQQLGIGGGMLSNVGGSVRYLYIFWKSLTDDLSLFVFLVGCVYCAATIYTSGSSDEV
ncbi:hypothetical protein HDU97_000960 [Phlyctochytrium planicorne]|nr:hypothetical protein HDU97_000960 [Phlyctochytrium planicorne]